ncbi:hypothetical protein [Bradyrhizobium sp. SZCCHNR2028]|uniref:hypothetical protein n=1 Tax=Bradyrhizobium sp. SZCCHNR2028 TaxID=3057382 RepID=UPI0028ECA325|nr:hypothetical protein [Bradyrhizobium sp. SZCCHNR2028]
MSEQGEEVDFSDTWDRDALVAKAKKYAEKMLEAPRDGWEFALWSSFCLEFLLRADLSDYDPALLADIKDVNNLISATGYSVNIKKFIPKTAATNDIVERLSKVAADFTAELSGFSLRHTSLRNGELHSGYNAFEGKKQSEWLPLFYKTCTFLTKDLSITLADIFGDDEAETAEKLIIAFKDDAAKAVKATINAHATVWKQKSESDQKKAIDISAVWATKHAGHRVKCPACQADAIVSGDAISSPRKSIIGDIITEKQEYLPSKFECVACDMKIAGLSQLAAAGLGDTYVKTQSFEASEYYASDEANEWDGYEPDYND